MRGISSLLLEVVFTCSLPRLSWSNTSLLRLSSLYRSCVGQGVADEAGFNLSSPSKWLMKPFLLWLMKRFLLLLTRISFWPRFTYNLIMKSFISIIINQKELVKLVYIFNQLDHTLPIL